MKTQRAFTIIELMVTMAVAAILITVAIPAMQDLVRNNRLVTQTNLLVSHIQLARSEAIKRSSQSALCRSADPQAATPTCSGSATTWTTGWLVFADGNGDGAYQSATDTLIRIGEATTGGITVRTNANADLNLRYNPNGTLNGNAALFAVCDGRDDPEDFGRHVQIAVTGRPSLTVGTVTTPLPANGCTNP